MIRNKTSCICFAICMAAVLITGCGSRKAVDSVGTPGITTESETAANEMDKAMIQEDVSAEEGQEGPGAMESSESPGTDKKSEAFAEKVQEAIADRDLEALADLLAYPCKFISMDKETIVFEKREDLLKLNPDMIFGDDLMVAVANVDTGSLNTKDEKIVLGEGESRITFQAGQDGSIGIIEIKE
jgi:outer membrane murein-binding lipoprotein Lpp